MGASHFPSHLVVYADVVDEQNAVRHDSAKLAEALLRLYAEKGDLPAANKGRSRACDRILPPSRAGAGHRLGTRGQYLRLNCFAWESSRRGRVDPARTP